MSIKYSTHKIKIVACTHTCKTTHPVNNEDFFN